MLYVPLVCGCTLSGCDDNMPCTTDSCVNDSCENVWNCTNTKECVLHLERDAAGILLRPWLPCVGQTFDNCTNVQVILTNRENEIDKYSQETRGNETSCEPNPCAGVCVLENDTYRCVCGAGQTGKRCLETLFVLNTAMILLYGIIATGAVVGAIVLCFCMLGQEITPAMTSKPPNSVKAMKIIKIKF